MPVSGGRVTSNCAGKLFVVAEIGAQAFFLAKKETKKHFASKITPSGADRPDKGPPVKRRNRFDFSVYHSFRGPIIIII